MIPKDGGNRFSGATNLSYRPGAWQGDNLTDRLKSAGLSVGNSTEYIYDLSGSEGGPIMKDKIWFFATARDYRTNNGITNTFFDNGRQGTDYNYIRDGLGRGTYQTEPEEQDLRLLRSHQQVPRPRHAEPVRPGNGVERLDIAELLHWPDEVDIDAVEPIALRRWVGVQHRAPQYGDAGRSREGTHMIQPGSGVPRMHCRGKRSAASPTRRHRRDAVATTFQLHGGTFVHYRQHHLKGGINGTYGNFLHEVRTNADLIQEYASVDSAAFKNGGGALVFQTPKSVQVRNTPVLSGEALNRDYGIFVQDTYTMSRLTLSAGVRYEVLNASVEGMTAPAGRFVPARTVPEKTGVPDWKNWAPRFQAIYDVFGDSKTAVKYSFNSYNQARTTGIASGFNTLSACVLNGTGATACPRLNWTDLNNDNIAQGARAWNADGTAFTDCVYLTAGCEINLEPVVEDVRDRGGQRNDVRFPAAVLARTGSRNPARTDVASVSERHHLPR